MALVLLATTNRVAPGLLTWRAWETLRSSRVLAGSEAHPQLPYLRAAGAAVEVLDAPDVRSLAAALVAAAADGPAVWLGSPEGDEELLRALGDLLVSGAELPEVEVELLHGSYDLPGARLLDLVATMDALRTGCPWDAKQTHQSLAPHLLEEAYEALDALETGDLLGLREELGDVLLQVVFHARVAQERAGETAFTIDDVAAGIVDKLVRRHPHVFGSVSVSGAEEVKTNWDAIKAAERAEKNGGEAGSVLDGVPFGQPALALASALQRRAARAEVPEELFAPPPGGGAAGRPAAAAADQPGLGAALGDELFALVCRARAAGLDPEAELRAAARRFRDRVRAWESAE